MPPKKNKKTQKKQKKEMAFTLKNVIDYLQSLANAKNSIRNWVDALSTLVYYSENEEPFPILLTKSEMADKYADIDMSKLIKDFDKVVDIVETQIKSSRDGQAIKVDTVKQYYLAVVRATQQGSPFQIPKELRNKYNDKLKEFGDLSNKQRDLNQPKKANLAHPDFTWNVVQKEYDDYVTSKPFTNTAKGKKELRIACAVGMYVLQRPRRVADYSSLQFFSKKPNEREADGRNILYIDDGKFYFSIDKFKTRTRVAGASKQAKEVLPRYIKEVNPRLADLFKKYLKLFNIKDMSKLTTEEKRQSKEYYIFFQEGKTQEDGYDDNSFSKFLSTCFKAVFNGRKGITVNSFRHVFNTWISEHIQEFTDSQLREIAIDVGDSPRSLPTNLRYRIANQNNKDMEKTQIEEMLVDDDYARNVMMADVGENASVGNVEQQETPNDDEVVSPSPVNFTSDASLDELYKQLGKAYMEVERIKLLIANKMGMS